MRPPTAALLCATPEALPARVLQEGQSGATGTGVRVLRRKCTAAVLSGRALFYRSRGILLYRFLSPCNPHVRCSTVLVSRPDWLGLAAVLTEMVIQSILLLPSRPNDIAISPPPHCQAAGSPCTISPKQMIDAEGGRPDVIDPA